MVKIVKQMVHYITVNQESKRKFPLSENYKYADCHMLIGKLSDVNHGGYEFVSETSFSDLDLHGKVIELAEIYRLVCRKWGGR